MSKKKATMTLKDFHGGSIPSDLRLPSAPGATVRPVDRPGFDRQMSWGNSVGKPDHRIRPLSAGSARNLEEKTPFFSHISHIGRNFDEDERTPLDGMSGPRRTIGDESLRVQPIRVVDTTKVDSSSGTRSGTRASSIPLAQSGSTASSYAGRVSEVHNARLNNQTYSGNQNYGSNASVMGGSAWGIRKDTTSIKEPTVSWSAPDAETKLAHASALEKVSSGRWNSKQQVHSPKDAEAEFGYNSKKTYHRPESVDSSYERSTYVTTANGLQPLHYHTGKSGGADFRSTVPLEASERLKLKLLPRSKPVENVESPTDFKQTINHLHVEDSYLVHEAKNPVQTDSVGVVVVDRAIERPKLNLKPRSQTPEQLEGNSESKRGTVFGGARPRELVLKARGVEDEVSSYDSPPLLRVKENLPKADTSAHLSPARHNEKAETNRRDHHLDSENNDLHRWNNRASEIRRNNNINNNNNNSQQPQQQKQDRPPSPDTWRKPVEPNDAPPTRYGKAASAVELAQAFSKSVSTDPTAADRLLGSRGGQGRGQIPFSRLTGPSPTPQINGY